MKMRKKKNVKKGIQFCLMVCGASGTGTMAQCTHGYHGWYWLDLTGRTTFVNTLCGKKVLSGKDADDVTNAHVEEGVKIKPITVGKQQLDLKIISKSNIDWHSCRVGIGRGRNPYFTHNCRHTWLWRPNRQWGKVGETHYNMNVSSWQMWSFGEIVGYLERQYDDILAEESRIKRNPRFRDNRVHALLYFITPTGHGYVASQSSPRNFKLTYFIAFAN